MPATLPWPKIPNMPAKNGCWRPSRATSCWRRNSTIAWAIVRRRVFTIAPPSRAEAARAPGRLARVLADGARLGARASRQPREPNRTACPEAPGGGLRDPKRLERVDGARRGRAAGTHRLDERLELETVGVPEPVDEPVIVVAGHAPRGVGPHRRRPLVLDDDLAPFALDLRPDVVSVDRPARVLDHAERARAEAEGEDRGVGVAELTDARVDERRAERAHLVHFAAEESRDVEVVDRHVLVDAAGGPEVVERGRLRVTGEGAEHLDPADGAGLDERPRPREARVVPALEADLEGHAGGLDGGERGAGVGHVEGDRLFREDRLAGPRRGRDLRGVQGGWRGDEERDDSAVGQHPLEVVGRVGAPPGRPLGRR